MENQHNFHSRTQSIQHFFHRIWMNLNEWRKNKTTASTMGRHARTDTRTQSKFTHLNVGSQVCFHAFELWLYEWKHATYKLKAMAFHPPIQIACINKRWSGANSHEYMCLCILFIVTVVFVEVFYSNGAHSHSHTSFFLVHCLAIKIKSQKEGQWERKPRKWVAFTAHANELIDFNNWFYACAELRPDKWWPKERNKLHHKAMGHEFIIAFTSFN